MSDLLVDTNVVSELARPVPSKAVQAFMAAADTTWYSVITVQEPRYGVLQMPRGRNRDAADRALERFLNFYGPSILPVGDEIAERTAYVRVVGKRAGHEPTLADAITAATALIYGIPLATRNTRDFTALGVKLIDPWRRR